MGKEIKFKPATFYLGVADHLAKVVEGQERVKNVGEGMESSNSERRSVSDDGTKPDMPGVKIEEVPESKGP
jgi:triacylglycerol lipase